MSSLFCPLADYYTDCCPEPEESRISAVAFVRNGLPNFDPELSQSWKDIICNGHGIIIPEVRGTYNGGELKEGPGYGRVPTRKQSINHEVSFMSLYNCDNVQFFNILNDSLGYTFWYTNGSRLWHSTKPVHAFTKAAITDDPSDSLEYETIVKWVHKDLPYCYNTPEVFQSCEELKRILDCLICKPIVFSCP